MSKENTSETVLSSRLLIFYISGLFMRPWELISEWNTLAWIPPLLFSLTIVASFFLSSLPRSHSAFRLDSSLITPGATALALGIWMLISTFKTANPMEAQSLFFLSAFRTLLIFLFILFLIRTDRDYYLVLHGVVFSVLILTVLALTKAPSGAQVTSRLQSKGLFADPNDLASILLMTLPWGLKIWRPLTRYLFTTIWLYAIFKSSSRGALLGLAALAGTWTLLKISSTPKRLGILIAVLVALSVFSKNLHRDADDLDQSASSRTNYWKAGINMALKQPILGVGFGSYPLEFERYAPEILYEWGERTAHSTWILILAETGFVGAFIFLSLFKTVCQAAWQGRHERPELLYSLVAYSTCMSFLSHSYTIFPWFLFGLILAASRPPKDSIQPRRQISESL